MVILAEQLENTDFHDSSLARCVSEGDTLHLFFRNIHLEIGKEEYYSASVTLRGVREIRRDKAPIREMKIEGDGNDVLQFHRGDGKALLLVQWDFYRPRAGVYAESHSSPHFADAKNPLNSLAFETA